MSQNIAYKCGNLNNEKIEFRINSLSSLNKKAGKQYVAAKYQLIRNGDIILSFNAYKHNKTLFILADNETPNPSSNQVLFSIPQNELIKLDLGTSGKMNLILKKYMILNGVSFYNYEASSSNSNNNLSEIIFDSNLDISEISISKDKSKCSCTKPNITIRLK